MSQLITKGNALPDVDYQCSLNSSDPAPGFSLLLFCNRSVGAISLSLGDFRALTVSLSATRGDVGLEEQLDLFMQLLAPISGCYVTPG